MEQDGIRVVIVDDHDVLRIGLTLALEADPGIRVVAEGSTGLDALRLCEQYEPDVLLLDLRMPEMDGLTAARQIHAVQPDIPILVLTSYMEQEFIKEALTIGVKGYLSKDVQSDDLIAAVRTVHAGRSMLAGEAIQKLIHTMQHPPTPVPKYDLTDRELEILRLVAEGLTNKQIADQLYIAVTTVKRHIANILVKMEVDTRTEAAVIAIRQNLVHSKNSTPPGL